MKSYEAIVVGASAGGAAAISTIAGRLPSNFSMPIVVVQHLYPYCSLDVSIAFSKVRDAKTTKEAEDKEELKPGMMYLAPAGYHLLIERQKTLSLSVETPENFSRPSIDVLFETAADAYGDKLIAVLLTGASTDGVDGLRTVKEQGGLTIIQDPNSAEVPFLPKAAAASVDADFILPLAEIREVFLRIDQECRRAKGKVG